MIKVEIVKSKEFKIQKFPGDTLLTRNPKLVTSNILSFFLLPLFYLPSLPFFQYSILYSCLRESAGFAVDALYVL